MRIANIIEKTEVEGPDLRAAIWVQGCTLNCPGCCNQEYLPTTGGTDWCPKKLAQYLAKLDVEGITLLGGEPLQQNTELYEFLTILRSISRLGVMLFTGYTWKMICGKKELLETVSLCDLVIAGPFLQQQISYNRRWIGSSNQTIHFITNRYNHLREWPKYRNEIEFHIRDGEIIINGTPYNTGII